MRWRAFGVSAMLWCAVGCGYHLAGTQVRLPADVRSVSVGSIENLSNEHGWEKLLAFALEREVMMRHQLAWEPNPARGDAVISGTVRSISLRPVAFNTRDQAVQYELAVVVDLKLTRRTDGAVLWRTDNMRVTGEYATSPNVVVTSSAAFQLQPLDASNLRDPQWSPLSATDAQAINIQLAEGEKRLLLRRLAQELARDVYNGMVEDF